MVLHANPRIFYPTQHQYRRGLCRFMQLHENCPIKRAGVAGRALRDNSNDAHLFSSPEYIVDVCR
ncbi:hypothetical protein AXK76_20130 [Salmonella enterica subsp. enterica]|nr:hypothetical protein [Salmonella enterica subsp. enterica]EEN6265786.1 hypothetical protein [Salmonella enterica]